jgi:hypothetical protein
MTYPMNDETKKYIENPQLILDILSNIVDHLNESNDSVALNDKEIQLHGINKLIKSWEEKSVPIPDSLRSEKSKLISEIGSLSTMPKLQSLQNGLIKILEKIGMDDQPGKKVNKPRSKQPKTDKATLRELIIKVLKKFDGSASGKEVREEMAKMLEGKLLAGDLEWREATKDYVWQNNTNWERFLMTKDGVLKNDSPRGIWELSEKYL